MSKFILTFYEISRTQSHAVNENLEQMGPVQLFVSSTLSKSTADSDQLREKFIANKISQVNLMNSTNCFTINGKYDSISLFRD